MAYYDLPVLKDRANKEKDKRAYLESFLDDIEILKLEISICRAMQILSLKKQAWIEHYSKWKQILQ